MASIRAIILEYIVPSVGVVTSSMMSSAAYFDVRRATLSAEGLGALNPTPWAFLMGNQLGWIVYSFMIQNIFVFLSNGPGFMLSVWLNMAAAKLQFENHRSNHMRQNILEGLERKLRSPDAENIARKHHEHGIGKMKGEESSSTDQGHWTSFHADFGHIVWDKSAENKPAPAPHEHLVLYVVAFWVTILGCAAFGGFDHDARELLVGVIVNINLIFVYGAPLSALLLVVRTKSSASIHVPTMLCNSVNSILWMVYGFSVSNPFIYITNILGTLLGIAQLVLKLWYPNDHKTLLTPHRPASRATSATTSVYSSDSSSTAMRETTPLMNGSVPANVLVERYQIV